jgi:DNA primase
MGSTLSPKQAELIRKITHAESRIVVMLDEDEAGRAGRAHALQCLADAAFVKVVRFEKEGQQPGDLSGDELSTLLGVRTG